MKTFKQLYNELVEANVKDNQDQFIQDYDPNHLDCLLHPKKHALIWRIEDCDCNSNGKKSACEEACNFDAIHPDEKGSRNIDIELCVGCSLCINSCNAQKLTSSRDIIPALKAIRCSDTLVYALVAPAFLGQFSPEVTPGKLRNALKQVGFDGMIEVALFADILTLKEALEFDANINKEEDYQLTSCCCPIWISLIKKIYNDLMPHVPGSVSPMIASGRAIKLLHPDSVTIFIGPCIAKKAEAREKDLVGAVDYVLTFQEIKNIFDAMEINPLQMEESEKDHSSRAGRIYARTGGVSEAVEKAVEKLNPNRKIMVKTQQADGVSACKAMINELISGNTKANFYEGMGCKGGCVGGPKSIIPVDEGRENVNIYGDEATYLTPIDNPYVIELLDRLGFETIESLLEDSEIFTRHF